MAHPPPDLPANEPSQHPRPRIQGGGHHHHAFRHGDAQQPGSLSPRDGRDRPGAGPRREGGARPPADDRPAPEAPAVHARPRGGLARHPRLGLALLNMRRNRGFLLIARSASPAGTRPSPLSAERWPATDAKDKVAAGMNPAAM